MIDFPASPTGGQIFNAPNGVVYQYSTTYSSWLAQTSGGVGGTGDFCAFTTAALGSAGNVVIAFPSVFSGNAGSWYNPANGRYTPPAGRYKLSTWWSCNYSGSAIQLAIDAIRKNGVAIPNTLSISGTIAANYNTAVNSEVIVDANGSDYFEVTAYASAWTAGRGWFMAFPLTGMGAGAGPYLPLAGGTLTGPLTGTTATFNGGGFNGALKVTTNDSIIGGLFAGATKGVRIVPNAAYTAIEGVDNTGVGSYQPLTISGSVVNIAAPLSGTTATFSNTVTVNGAGQATASPSTSTGLGATLYARDSGVGAGNGGMVMFGAGQGAFAAIKSYITDGANNTRGDLILATRRVNADATLTNSVQFGSDGTTSFFGQINGTTATFSGTVGVGGVPTEKFTVVSPDNLTGNIVGVYANNLTQGVGIHWDGIRKIGPAADLSINVDGKGAGFVGLGFNCTGYTTLGRDPPAASNTNHAATTAWCRANISGGGGSGKLLQTVYNRTGTGGSGTTIIPFDTTIPQITEGDEYMTLAVTPTSATSLLIIDVVWIGSSSAVNNMGVALFKDATASALTAAAATVTAANATVNIKFKYIMVSGSTTATTFRVRAGGGAAGTTSFNSGTTFGFVMCSSMTIQEVTP